MKSKKGLLSLLAGLIVLIGAAALYYVLSHEPKGRAGEQESYETAPLAISVDVPNGLKVGVIYSLSESPAVESSFWKSAEGIQVAKYRIEKGGSEVALLTADDRGSENGAQEAVASLADQGVSAIIVATSGPHTSAIAETAREMRIPAIFLYEGDAVELGDGIWTMAPTEAEVAGNIRKTLNSRNYSRSLLVSYEGKLEAVPAAHTIPYAASTDLAVLGEEIYQALNDEEKRIDSIVISGPSRYQTDILGELKKRAITVPLILDTSARAPAFGERISSEGILSGDYTTVGIPSIDMIALSGNLAGNAAAVFFTALRLMDDIETTDLLAQSPFAESCEYADGVSHDALLAIAIAAEQAGSAEANAVAKALSDVQLTTDNGAVTGDADFRGGNAKAQSFGSLRASTLDPNLRTSTSPLLFWFSEQ